MLGLHCWPLFVFSAGSLLAPLGSPMRHTYHLLLVPGCSTFIWAFAHGLPFTVHSHQLLLLQNSGQASLLWGSPLTAPARVRGPSSGRRSHTGRLMRYWVVWFNSCCLPPPLVRGPFGQRLNSLYCHSCSQRRAWQHVLRVC